MSSSGAGPGASHRPWHPSTGHPALVSHVTTCMHWTQHWQHCSTQSSVVCTADHNTRLLVSGYLQNWAILSRCITGDMLQCHATNQNNATTITDITAVSSDQWLVMDAAVLQSVASHPALQLMEPLIMG